MNLKVKFAGIPNPESVGISFRECLTAVLLGYRTCIVQVIDF